MKEHYASVADFYQHRLNMGSIGGEKLDLATAMELRLLISKYRSLSK